MFVFRAEICKNAVKIHVANSEDLDQTAFRLLFKKQSDLGLHLSWFSGLELKKIQSG